MTNQNLLGEPEATLLPMDPSAALIVDGASAREAAARHPTSSLAWAVLAEEALRAGETVAGYAYARTGYHRGLDALRGSGWKGHGPIPWEHEPNRGFLRALAALGQAAARIGEADEEQRCRTFLRDSSPTAATELGSPTG